MDQGEKIEYLEKKMEDLEKKIQEVAARAKADSMAQARAAALSYYTNQLVSHAFILLTLALVFFTALQTFREFELPLKLGWLYGPMILIAGSVTLWQVSRYLYHG